MDSHSAIPENHVDTPKSRARIGHMLEHVRREYEIELCRGEGFGYCFRVASPDLDTVAPAVQNERHVPIGHYQPVHIGLEELALVAVASSQLERGRKRAWRTPAEDHVDLALSDRVKVRAPVHQAHREAGFIASKTILCWQGSRQGSAPWRAARSGPQAAFPPH